MSPNTNHHESDHLPTRVKHDLATRTQSIPLLGTDAPLRQQITEVQTISTQSQSTTWRRAFLVWLRIYQYEKQEGRKAKVLDLRIPIPLPVLGLLFPRNLSWDQALRVLKHIRAQDNHLVEPALEGSMAIEFLRIEEEKAHKQEILVIGID